MPNKNFTFEISLSVLNHLGRNLYRSFITVLGEAISNSWDANAENVWIYINKEKNSFFIKDDGIGMTGDDFQNKFLKIGYSKRKEGKFSPQKNRPYIGRKGIGKLALLSYADRITVISKKRGGEYVGGVIDNSGLDRAITEDLKPEEYELGKWEPGTFGKYIKDHNQGTIVYFENIKDEIRHSLAFFKKAVALYFRFSLLDKDFNIFIEDELITLDCLDDLVSNTQYLWKINDIDDPYIKKLQEKFTPENNEEKQLKVESNIKGFIASVKLPHHLKVITTGEKVGVDLFVNGRLREKDILKHIPTARVVESYLYGQIHFNDLDDDTDRFTTSRESIVAEDPKYKELLECVRSKIISKILDDWDAWRRKHREEGDSENTSISKKERKAGELYNAVSEEYALPKDSKNRKKVDGWVDDLSEDAAFNFGSYAGCFISENLVRKYIQEKNISPAAEQREIDLWRNREARKKRVGNLSIDIRQSNDDLFYLSMEHLVKVAEPPSDGFPDTLLTDEKQFTPIRDAVMHTSRLTKEAKRRLRSVYDNIKGRIKTLLSRKNTRT